jgi:putative endonuclease
MGIVGGDFVVYVLFSDSAGKIYVGFTRDIENRMHWHNSKAKKGYTIKFRPWKIIYKEQFILESEARIREKQLKSQKGREFIWNLISTDQKNSSDS